MEKKGFTLVELLVVIAIIAILSIIIVPSVINVNKNVNNRLLDSKKESITSAAQIYASKNDDIFNGVDEVPVYVYELIDMGYLDIDVVRGADARCTNASSHNAKGCIINPVTSTSLNDDYVILRKQGAAGYFVEYHSSTDEIGENTVSDQTLVDAVCNAFNDEDNPLTGKASVSGTTKTCYCYKSSGSTSYNELRVDGPTGSLVNACIVAGENPNNYLRYGDSKPNWRVLGVYKIDGVLYAKMITNEPI